MKNAQLIPDCAIESVFLNQELNRDIIFACHIDEGEAALADSNLVCYLQDLNKLNLDKLESNLDYNPMQIFTEIHRQGDNQKAIIQLTWWFQRL
ncbi:7384_t:CDS:2, partial [Racocetra fulgida]